MSGGILMADKIVFARVTGGDTYDYLKTIDIVGPVGVVGDLIVYGCKDADQPRFYEGLFNMDKTDPVQGWQTAEDVKEWWEEGGDGMLMYVKKGNFEVVENSYFLAK
jgi:NADPH-dependent curcumin reductase CurA